jgi:hypothetical protein
LSESEIDASRFPEAAAYVARLPQGLASHRHCEVKGSVVREIAASIDASVAAALPEPLRALVTQPPPVSAWVSEVPVNALILVQHELLKQRTGDPSAMIDRAFDSTRALLSTPLYKILFLVMSPERLLSGIDKRWGALRRGTYVEALEHTAKLARICVHFPQNHYNQTLLAIRAASVRAALVCAGGRDARVDVEPSSAETIDYVCHWQ